MKTPIAMLGKTPTPYVAMAALLYAAAWVLPFVQHGTQSLRGPAVVYAFLSAGWTRAVTVLCLTSGVVIGTFIVLLNLSRPPRAIAWLLGAGLALSIGLNTAAILQAPVRLLPGFYAWYATFLVLGLGAWRAVSPRRADPVSGRLPKS